MNTKLIHQLDDFNRSAARNHSVHTDFVGAVYDTTSGPPESDLILIVGINYGQKKTSRESVNQSADSIGYAAKMPEILGTPDKPYQAVLWNFFPYLLADEWNDAVKNAAREAQLIFDEGYKDPFGVFRDLHAILKPSAVVFHGVTSAVPVLARTAIRQIPCSALLVHNLSRPSKFAGTRII